MDKIKPTSRSFEAHGQTMDKGGVHIEVVQLGDLKVKRQTYPPGWRFSRDMGQALCYDTHVGYAISGHVHVELQRRRGARDHRRRRLRHPAGPRRVDHRG